VELLPRKAEQRFKGAGGLIHVGIHGLSLSFNNNILSTLLILMLRLFCIGPFADS
jgi:hypothetical protein